MITLTTLVDPPPQVHNKNAQLQYVIPEKMITIYADNKGSEISRGIDYVRQTRDASPFSNLQAAIQSLRNI